MAITIGRTPHGVRGLKSSGSRLTPTRGSRTPHGVRGLKSHVMVGVGRVPGRTPHGVRGLKFDRVPAELVHTVVAPLTGCVD